jgi:hypothetical protein
MKKALILLLLFGFTNSGYSQTLRQINFVHRVKTKENCTAKNGYWYNDKCWANFKEKNQESSKLDMDSLVLTHAKLIREASITVNENKYLLDAFYPEEDNLYFQFSFVYSDGDSQKTLQQRVRRSIVKARKQFLAEVKLFEGNIFELPDSVSYKPIAMGRIKGNYTDFNKKDFQFTGVLRDLVNRKNTYQIDFTCSDALWKTGTSTLELQGNKAILNGEVGVTTYAQIQNIISKHPEIKTLILGKILNAVDDETNERIAEIIRKSKLNTKLLATSEITLNGVKLFCAGNKRIITRGAKIGVNSWDNGNYKGKDLPKEHPLHQYKTPYYKNYLGDKGTDFYFYTLNTNVTNDIIWLDEEQLRKWNVATEIIDDTPIKIDYPNIPENIANMGYSFGNNQSNIVIINAQENPDLYLYTDEFKELFIKYGNVNPEQSFVINVHQAQTLHPSKLQNQDISFQQAKEYSSETTEILATVVNYFKSQNKKVILVGMSYGAFVVQDFLAEYGNTVDAILLSVGRLDMSDTAWKDFSQGKIVSFREEIEMKSDNQTISIQNSNKSKLVAAYAYKRFTELLKNTNLTNTIYVYGKNDEMLGSLTKEEKAFLMKKDVLVLSVDNGHKETLTGFLKKGLQMLMK